MPLDRAGAHEPPPARGRRTDDDCDLLRAEFHFTRELADLGVDTMAPADMRLVEGERFPSLWLPRFDREWRNDAWVHLGMESVASLMGAAPGAFLDQADTVRRLVSVLGGQDRVREKGESFDHEAFVVEWVRRDFLNVAFGNSDNHGRNSALLKGPEGIRLSPVFDFAPMRMDPEGVVRALRWAPPLEAGGTFDWHAIARELGDLISPDHLIHELEQLARRLVGLADRLEHRGLPQRVLTAEPVGLARLDARLRRWGLL